MSGIYSKDEAEKAIKEFEVEIKSKYGYGGNSILNIFTFYGFVFSPLIYFDVMTLRSVSFILTITEIVLLIGYFFIRNVLKKEMKK